MSNALSFVSAVKILIFHHFWLLKYEEFDEMTFEDVNLDLGNYNGEFSGISFTKC